MINAWYFKHTNANVSVIEKINMVKAFQFKTLFAAQELTKLVQNFGLRKRPAPEIGDSIHEAFRDYILSALSELGDQSEDKNMLHRSAISFGKRRPTARRYATSGGKNVL